MELTVDEAALAECAARLGKRLSGNETIELIGDVGSGKTTFTKALARGMGIDEDVQSPSFTISRIYTTPSGQRLAHYDFYRLRDAGILAIELEETLQDPQTVTVIEWAALVDDVLPADRLRIVFQSPSETIRHLVFTAGGPSSQRLVEGLHVTAA